MSKTVIITSYIEFSLNLGEFIDSDDFIICADGGYDKAAGSGIVPDLIMGDFDSLSCHVPDNIDVIRFNPEKDYTDLDLALKYCKEQSEENVYIIGGIGGRLDHTVANLQLLSHYCNSFKKLVLMDGRNKCFALRSDTPHETVIPSEPDSYLSIFSLSETCRIKSFSGVKYTLADYTLTRNFPLGVSNEFIAENAVLSIENGTLLLVISKK
ncbi:MAG: thiamine diphosphokinase [Lentihominibacter sp.]